MPIITHDQSLRAWARGDYTCEAATELLIRGFGGRFSRAGQPWVMQDHEYGNWWIDFESIPELAGGLSGGERRFLNIAASIATNVPVILGEILPGLDRGNVKLVLAAVSHAAGSHEHSGMRISDDGTQMIKDPSESGALYPWP